jgi:hypothetical protein
LTGPLCPLSVRSSPPLTADPGRAILTFCDQPVPAWGHGDGPDRAGVPLRDFPTSGRIPEPGRAGALKTTGVETARSGPCLPPGTRTGGAVRRQSCGSSRCVPRSACPWSRKLAA